jgi:hypothetical protein
MASILEKVNVLFPLIEIMKIPYLMDKENKFLSIQESYEDPPILLQSMHYDPRKEEHAPFFITLVVNDLLLHNCMLDSGDSANVMSLKVMNQLGLNITRPYRNVCGIDSKSIKFCGVIKDLKVHLYTYPEVSLSMDVIVIDVPNAWGMLLSRKWAATLGGSLQMDLSYATIPIGYGSYVTLYNHPMIKHHVEDPRYRYD